MPTNPFVNPHPPLPAQSPPAAIDGAVVVPIPPAPAGDGEALVSEDGSWIADTIAGGSGGAVDSVFGRTGAVAAQSGDYNSDQVSNSSGVAGANVTAALNALSAAIAAIVPGVPSVFGRTGAISAQSGDYNSTLVTNSSSVSGANVTAALNTLATTIAGLTTGVSSVFTRTGAVTAQTGDYNSDQINNDSLVSSGAGSVSAALNALRDGSGLSISNDVSMSSNILTAKNFRTPSEVDDGNAGAADTIDFTAAPAHRSLLDTASCTFTYTVATGSFTTGLIHKLVQDGTGNRSIVLPAIVANASDLQSALVKTANTTAIISYYHDGTELWGGFLCNGAT